MEIRVRGEMTIADIRQALFEQLHEFESNYAVKYSRGATLYVNPTNGFGDDVAWSTQSAALDASPPLESGMGEKVLYDLAVVSSAHPEPS
jgi:hypothetical protein